jgi:transposase-like protein
MLKYKCPKTSREVTTSIKTDTVTLLEMRAMKISVWCPHCATSHQIRASDAYLENFVMAAE